MADPTNTHDCCPRYCRCRCKGGRPKTFSLLMSSLRTTRCRNSCGWKPAGPRWPLSILPPVFSKMSCSSVRARTPKPCATIFARPPGTWKTSRRTSRSSSSQHTRETGRPCRFWKDGLRGLPSVFSAFPIRPAYMGSAIRRQAPVSYTKDPIIPTASGICFLTRGPGGGDAWHHQHSFAGGKRLASLRPLSGASCGRKIYRSRVATDDQGANSLGGE